MNSENISEQIVKLKQADDNLRAKLLKEESLFEGYHPEMQALHNRNAEALQQIIETIGYPSPAKVGKEASEAAWLIIQHAIGKPEFMKRSAALLQEAVQQKQADPVHLAYLQDRIAFFEGRVQLYGTHFDWDEKGDMNLYQVDDLSKVNDRRKALGMSPLKEHIKDIQNKVTNEMQGLPIDYQKRKLEFEKWRKTVGWIK